MLVYIYDGSFPGLLTAIYESYYRREKPEEILAQDQWQHTLFAQEVVIKTDEKKQIRFIRQLRTKSQVLQPVTPTVFFSRSAWSGDVNL